MKKYYLGIDLGTSAIKGILRSVDGEIFKARIPYADVSVNAWKTALKGLISALDLQNVGGSVEAIAFSSQVGTYIVDGEEVISWQDSAGKSELEEIKAKISQEEFLQEISMQHPDVISYPLPRLLYIKRKYGNDVQVLQPKDLLIRELTDETVTDIYSMRGIVDLDTGKYATRIMQSLGLNFALPTVKLPTDLAGYITKKAAKEYGLPIGVPVYLGCNDFFAGLLGMGMYATNEAFDLSGTSEHIGWIAEDLQKQAFVSGGYFNGFCTYGGTKSSGASCDFAIENFGVENLDFEEILKGNPPIFLPYLNGERAPIYDENARGVYFVITSETTKKELAYATLEGVVFSLYDIAQSMQMPTPKRLICAGGSAKNILMSKIKAEVFDCEIVRAEENDGSALGAVMLAMVGAGHYANFNDAICDCIVYGQGIKPNGGYREKLLKRFEIYREMYKNLKITFEKFSKI